MGALDIVMDIANRHVDWPVFIVASANRDSGLVASKNNWDEHGAVRNWIIGNYILKQY
jgi:hypothetical protein